MVYEYVCNGPKCARRFDVIKRAADMEKEERCQFCDTVATRQFVPQRVYFSGTKVEDAVYNPGLGCVVRNSSHQKQICKDRGLIEIGNEKPETVHKIYDNARKEKWEKSWTDVDKGWVGSE